MATNKIDCNYGEIEVRNIMIEIDDTNLEEGLEFSGDDIDTFEVFGYKDVDELTADEVDDFIENNQKPLPTFWGYISFNRKKSRG